MGREFTERGNYYSARLAGDTLFLVGNGDGRSVLIGVDLTTGDETRTTIGAWSGRNGEWWECEQSRIEDIDEAAGEILVSRKEREATFVTCYCFPAKASLPVAA